MALSVLMMISCCFAADNDTMLSDGLENGTDIVNQTDYYFDMGLDIDGNGSADSPYNNFTDERINDDSVIHLASGEYVFNNSRIFSNISFYGADAQDTVLDGNGSNLTVNGTVNFRNITLTNFMIINLASLNASNVIFKNMLPAHVKDDSYGGAIYAPSNRDIHLDNCIFVGNQAEYGGAVYVRGGSLTIVNSLFYNNLAYNYGGAIAAESRVKIIINNTRFSNVSSANDAGGAIYLVSSSLSASNMSVSNSSATFGAAVTSINSDLDLNNVTLMDNTARYEGGAIYQIYGSIFLNSSRLINNSARNGGGLFIDDVNVHNITFNEFTSNFASNYGGAIYSLLSHCNMTTNTFFNNSAFLFNETYFTSGINLTLGNGNYSMYVFNQTSVSALPSHYDLRDDGYVTPVKDQGDGGNCWAFAALASLESCILKASGEVLDLSEENLKNLMAHFSDYGFKDWMPNGGGNKGMAVAYLVSWLGPLNESDDMYDDLSHISPVLESIMHVQNVLYLKRDNATDNDAIKQAILDYGAVSTSMYYDIAGVYDGKIYHYYTGDENVNHDVAIVGWDDNFYIPGAPGRGAWIAKNSWGESWLSQYHTGGYFYISYYDKAFARPGTYSSLTFILNDTIHFDRNYQHEVSGPTDYFYNTVNTVMYENAYYAMDNEFLAAVSTYFNTDTQWEVLVYVNSLLQIVQNGSATPGYFTINLDYPIPLAKGDLFEIIFRIAVDGDVGFPISEYMSLNKLTYSPNMSFVSYDDGKTWYDLYDLIHYYPSPYYFNHHYNSQVACIKGFTQFITLNSTVQSLNVTYDMLDLYNVTANVLDENGNAAGNGNVTFYVNGANYTAEIYKGIASVKVPLSLGLNSIFAVFESPNYYSSNSSTTYEVSPIALDADIVVVQDLKDAYLTFTFSQMINETILIDINGQNQTVKTVDGVYRLNLTDLDYGNYTVNVTLISDYFTADNSTSFFVDVKRTYLSVSDVETFYRSGEAIEIKLYDELGQPLNDTQIKIILDGADFQNGTVHDGCFSIPVLFNVGNHTFEAVFEGDQSYAASKNSSWVNVTKSQTRINITRISYNSFNLFDIEADVFDQLNQSVSEGTITFTVNNVEYDNGRLIPLAVGKNNISVVFNASNYCLSANHISYDVLPVDLMLNISVVQDFNNANIHFKSCQQVNETLIITINNHSSSFKLTDGQFQLNFTGLDYGKYVVEAQMVSDFYKSANSTSFFVNVKRTSIQANDLTTTYNSGEFLEIRLTDQLSQSVVGREVNCSIDDNIYYTDENGTALIPVRLMNGVYQITVSFEGDDSHIKSQNTSTVTVKSTIVLPEIKNYALNSNYDVCLLDRDGSALVNAVVTFTFNNRDYDVVSDSSGKATFIIPADSGSYDVYVSNPVSGEKLSQKVNVIKRIAENRDASIYYGNYLTYKIRLCNDDGEFAGNLEARITLNKKSYLIKTDKDGYAILRIKLNSGNYVITSEYKGFKVSNKITVKPTLITKNVKAKKGKAVKFTAKLLSKNGKVLKNKKIIFKIKGKVYKAKTNKKGIATIKIRNLKVGKYTVTTKYGKLQNKNRITVKR